MTDMHPLTIDLNCDVGEGCASDGLLMASVTSVNIACGAHAGSRETMITALEQAQEFGVRVGAHPGYADPENFGRVEHLLTARDVESLVESQLHLLGELAVARGVSIAHLKPHGGLYHVARRDPDTAAAIARVVDRFDPEIAIVGPAHSALAHAAEGLGLSFHREAFADRAYLASGDLVPRGRGGGGVWHDVQRVVDQVVGIVTRGKVVAVDGTTVTIEADTICLHGDTPCAADLAGAVRRTLDQLATR